MAQTLSLPSVLDARPGELVGSTTPRLFTRPLVEGPPGPCGCGCALTPQTSRGFEVADFAADVLQRPLMPWQRWLAIHALETLPSGLLRFRTVITLVGRQNGKTELLVVLALYWLYVEQVKLVLGTSTNLDYARESWEKAVDLAQDTPSLAAEIPMPSGIRRANGEQALTTSARCRYKIAPANRRGGRSLTVHRLIADELREHKTWEAWGAAFGAMNAVIDAQAWAISNAGDDTSEVLNHFRAVGVAGADPQLGHFEWSAPDGCALDDRAGWAQSNPSLGYLMTETSIEAALVQPPAVFRTEVLCQRVPSLDQAIPLDAWRATADAQPAPLSDLRDKVALCLDVSMDLSHATLVGAAVQGDGRVRLEVVAAWASTGALRDELPGLLKRVAPRALGWFPAGPAAALAADLGLVRKGVEITGGDVPQVCQGFAEQVSSRRIVHSNDPLLTAHVEGTQRLYQGDGWRFGRRGAGNVDAAYAAAGAVHLARTLPPSLGRPRLVRVRVSSEV